MRTILGLASLGLFLTSSPMNAASLCNCCTTAVAENCSAVCGPAKPAPGQCIAMVDYAGEAMIADGDNPLYGISLLNLELGMPCGLSWKRSGGCLKICGAG